MFGISLRFFKSINANVIFQLTVIGSLIVINYSIVQIYDSYLSEIEKTIDVVGSNRTYAQKIALNAKMLLDGNESYKEKVRDAALEFERHLEILKNGGQIQVGNKSYQQEAVPPNLRNYLTTLQTLWNTYERDAKLVYNSKTFIKNGEISPKVKEAINNLVKNSDNIYQKNDDLVKAYLEYFDGEQDERDFIFTFVFFFNIAVIGTMYLYINANVVRPVSQLNQIDNIIKEGNYERTINYSRDDELGRVGRSINTLFQNLKNATDFILNIGEGKLDVDYQKASETEASKDRLGTALQEMRDKMRTVAEEDSQRRWQSEGLAKFADIFSSKSQDEDFTYIIISELVKYLNANQGGLFIVEDERESTAHLELVAAFAFEKRKYIEKNIAKGEGLIGEVYQDGTTMYITDVPDVYINITSGLGDAPPRSLLIVPLKLNEEVYGVVEVAAFEPFPQYKIDFVENLGESIASTFASVKNAQRNEKLLKESVQLGEQMKAQEEEMRQNLEELLATQEGAERKSQKLEEDKVELEKELQEVEKKNETLEIQRRNLQQNLHTLRTEKAELEKELEEQKRLYAELRTLYPETPKVENPNSEE